MRFDMRIWTIVLRVTATLLACMMSAAKPQEATAARAAMPDDMAKSGSASARNQRMWSMELAELRRDREPFSRRLRKPAKFYVCPSKRKPFLRTTIYKSRSRMWPSRALASARRSCSSRCAAASWARELGEQLEPRLASGTDAARGEQS